MSLEAVLPAPDRDRSRRDGLFDLAAGEGLAEATMRKRCCRCRVANVAVVLVVDHSRVFVLVFAHTRVFGAEEGSNLTTSIFVSSDAVVQLARDICIVMGKRVRGSIMCTFRFVDLAQHDVMHHVHFAQVLLLNAGETHVFCMCFRSTTSV